MLLLFHRRSALSEKDSVGPIRFILIAPVLDSNTENVKSVFKEGKALATMDVPAIDLILKSQKYAQFFKSLQFCINSVQILFSFSNSPSLYTISNLYILFCRKLHISKTYAKTYHFCCWDNTNIRRRKYKLLQQFHSSSFLAEFHAKLCNIFRLAEPSW